MKRHKLLDAVNNEASYIVSVSKRLHGQEPPALQQTREKDNCRPHRSIGQSDAVLQGDKALDVQGAGLWKGDNISNGRKGSQFRAKADRSAKQPGLLSVCLH